MQLDTNGYTQQALRSSCGWTDRRDSPPPCAHNLRHSGIHMLLHSYSHQRSSWGNHAGVQTVLNIFLLDGENGEETLASASNYFITPPPKEKKKKERK